MVFSSIPGYVDPPNWHQQPNHHHHQANGSDNTQLLPPLPPQVGGNTGGGGTMGSIRPGSMADRARLAKLPPPEPALKCPRCNSTNTKFCYFNNYNLNQPRHFCKTCRRYWTKGGALRNVPVGGGCRRNKKNKRSRSKSPSTNSHEKQTSSSAIPSHHELIGHQLPPHPITNLPFMSSLQNLNRYAVGNVNMNLGLREIQEQQQQQTDHMGFQIGVGNGNSSASASVSASAVVGGGVEQWRNLQQFPFLNNFESNNSVGNSYPFQGENIEAEESGYVGDIASNSRVITQEPPVKMEENRALNLSRSSLGVSEHNQQYYSWNDLSGSSTSHLL